MTSPLARLRDTFADGVDPHAALFCTYGLDAPFFEAEILPAAFPERLSLDREAGSRAAYLAAADQVMQSTNVIVFFDHLTSDGPGLPYVAARVDVKPRAFHPKLALLDYEDRFRVVVSSANLTRPAWTSLLELFIAEDLVRGTAHPWSATLQDFLRRLEPFVPRERRDDVEELRARLELVPAGGDGSRLLSSWDGPLLPRVREHLAPASRLDVVTPFFEGEEGEGVLEQLESLGDRPKGRLFVSAQALEDRLEIRGPQDKIDALLSTRRWSLRRVAEEWEGDQEGAPLRALHGKMLAISGVRRSRVMVGSANITRTALLGSPPTGNVELVVVFDTTPGRLAHLLPQATTLDREDVDIVGQGDLTGEDDDTAAGAERWIESAVFWADSSTIEVRLVTGSPGIVVSYDGTELGEVTSTNVRFLVELRESFSVDVFDGHTVGVVPLLLADPTTFVPRGSPASVDFETFCDLLAGTRGPEMPTGELPHLVVTSGDADAGLAPRRGAIPWRRILAAVQGLGETLKEEAPFPRGVKFVLSNPTRLAGFLIRLKNERDQGRFQPADHAYALHEIRRMLHAASAAMGNHPASAELVSEALGQITAGFEEIRSAASDDLAAQLRILDAEVAR